MLVRTLCALIWLRVAANGVCAQTTAFTYQGKLTDAGNPANANYDLQFKLFDTVTVGTGMQQGATLVRNPMMVSAGLFTVTLDLGACVFNDITVGAVSSARKANHRVIGTTKASTTTTRCAAHAHLSNLIASCGLLGVTK